MFTGIAKLMPSVPRFCASTAVLMPISSPSRVDERATGIAEIDGGVGLNEILEVRDAEPAAAGGADDALRHGLAEAERIADRQHDVAGAQLVRAAHRHDRRVLDRHAQNRQIGIGILADDLGRGDAAVGELDPDFVRTLHHVVIRNDMTGAIDDHTGAEAAFDALAHGRQMLLQQWIAARGRGGRVDDPRRVDVDDGGSGTPHGVRERAALARRRRQSVRAPLLDARCRRRCRSARADQQQHAGARQTDDGPAEQEDGSLSQCGHGAERSEYSRIPFGAVPRVEVRRAKCV